MQWKKVPYGDKVGDEFEATHGVAPFGLFIALVEHYVEGRQYPSRPMITTDFVNSSNLRGENRRRCPHGDKSELQVVRGEMDDQVDWLAISEASGGRSGPRQPVRSK